MYLITHTNGPVVTTQRIALKSSATDRAYSLTAAQRGSRATVTSKRLIQWGNGLAKAITFHWRLSHVETRVLWARKGTQ